jgi:hypothetical protein
VALVPGKYRFSGAAPRGEKSHLVQGIAALQAKLSELVMPATPPFRKKGRT